MTPLHDWVTSVRKKFGLDQGPSDLIYWEGYKAAINDVERFADRLEHDPTGACLLSDRNHEGPHVVPPGHPVLEKVKKK